METRYYVGIDAGSVSVNSVVIDNKKSVVWEAPYIRHLGRVEDVVSGLLEEIFQKFGANAIESISFTGNHGKKLADQTGAFYEFDTIAQVLGALYVCPSVKSIISMGGQDTALFQIRHHEGGGWDLEYFNTNGPCASGTGSFIDQQAERLATSMYRGDVELSAHRIEHILKDFIQLGMKSSRPSNVACRCTVFTKSDMIHLQNKGERLEDIIYGLHVGNAR
ncbi:MAG TPA: CoA activase, partial [Desulfobacterales bacterium]|nr:CoA activase [Desulfobacterales bacterium]